MKSIAMKTVAVFGLSMLCASALASQTCYPVPLGQAMPGAYPNTSQEQAAYPQGAQPAEQEQSVLQPCGPGYQAPQQSGNVVTRAVDAAKQQADAEVQYEARRRVRHAFDQMFRRY